MGTKLYVGNLSWETTEGSLAEAFGQAGAVVSATIPLNDMGRSRGFAFVEMSSEEEAQKAIELYNEHELDGRVLRVNEANQSVGEGGAAGGTGVVNNRKLFVGNLSWNTTEENLNEMFAQAGSVVSVRIPLNDMGKSRGIAFVEMATEEDAQKAIELFHEKSIDGRNITVNIARPPAPRAARRPRDNQFGGGNGGGGHRDRSDYNHNDYSRNSY